MFSVKLTQRSKPTTISFPRVEHKRRQMNKNFKVAPKNPCCSFPELISFHSSAIRVKLSNRNKNYPFPFLQLIKTVNVFDHDRMRINAKAINATIIVASSKTDDGELPRFSFSFLIMTKGWFNLRSESQVSFYSSERHSSCRLS